MADRLKDELDIKLESLFRSDPVADDGFTIKVVSRVRRRMWVRRLALPTAFVIGSAFAAKPILQLTTLLPGLLNAVPESLSFIDSISLGSLPQMSTVIFGAMLLAGAMMIGRMLED